MNSSIVAVVTGEYVAPRGTRSAGRRVPVVAYLIRHPEMTILFDTGFPFDGPTEVREGAFSIPVYPRSLSEELGRVGCRLADLDVVANCHLHIDHAGGNFRLPPEIPIYVQEEEYRNASDEQDPIARDALALRRQSYQPISSQTDIFEGVTVLPTPGHTPGHQSLLVSAREGAVLLAGQAVGSAADFESMFNEYQRTADGGPRPDESSEPSWMARVEESRPALAMFAHDLAIWRRPTTDSARADILK